MQTSIKIYYSSNTFAVRHTNHCFLLSLATVQKADNMHTRGTVRTEDRQDLIASLVQTLV